MCRGLRRDEGYVMQREGRATDGALEASIGRQVTYDLHKAKTTIEGCSSRYVRGRKAHLVQVHGNCVNP
jgi:hypothetical protein